jgi:hypothetical protein
LINLYLKLKIQIFLIFIIMKAFIRKIRKIRKREALKKLIKRINRIEKIKLITTLGTGIGFGLLLRHGRINSDVNLFSNSNQSNQCVERQISREPTYQQMTDATHVNTQAVSSPRIQMGSGYTLAREERVTRKSESLQYALELRNGDLGFSDLPTPNPKPHGAGARARADVAKNWGKKNRLLPGADAFVSPTSYSNYQKSLKPLGPSSNKKGVRLLDSPFQGNNADGPPPPRKWKLSN